MHTIEKLERAVGEAVQRGYEVRMEPLGGGSGGLCEFGKRRWIFVDVTASVAEQLEQVLSALRAETKQPQAKPQAERDAKAA